MKKHSIPAAVCSHEFLRLWARGEEGGHRGNGYYGEVIRAISVRPGGALTRMQRGVNAREGDEKQGDRGKEKPGPEMECPCPYVMLLGTQHDIQPLLHTSPFRAVTHRASWPCCARYTQGQSQVPLLSQIGEWGLSQPHGADPRIPGWVCTPLLHLSLLWHSVSPVRW